MQLSLFEIDTATGDVVTPDQPKTAHVQAFGQPVALLPCPFPEVAAEGLPVPVPESDGWGWVAQGCCPICTGDLAVYRHVYPFDGASAVWLCLSDPLHGLAREQFNPDAHIVRNGREYRTVPTSSLPWLELYQGEEGRVPPHRRYLCDSCKGLGRIRPSYQGKWLCEGCSPPGNAYQEAAEAAREIAKDVYAKKGEERRDGS